MRDRDWIWIAVVAWGTGLAALSCDHWQLPGSLALEARTLFGIVTCGAISLVLFEKTRHPESITRHELYLWTRLVSRWVYIFMYVLALARIGFYLGESHLHCATCVAQHPLNTTVRPLDDFQFYIACCVIPLWVIRAAVLTVPVLQGSPAEDREIEADSPQSTRRRVA
jgi:hypothetical protein